MIECHNCNFKAQIAVELNDSGSDLIMIWRYCPNCGVMNNRRTYQKRDWARRDVDEPLGRRTYDHTLRHSLRADRRREDRRKETQE